MRLREDDEGARSGGTKTVEISRWMLIRVAQKYRSTALDRELQYFQVHGNATVKIGGAEPYVPLNDLPERTPIIAVRRYEVSAEICILRIITDMDRIGAILLMMENWARQYIVMPILTLC